MRPVNKGDPPKDASGNAVVFSEYKLARPHLIAVIGEYCSYCGMKLVSGLAVEHVLPKSKHPTLENSWENFLLACPNCNSTKGDEDINIEDYHWPDKHNT